MPISFRSWGLIALVMTALLLLVPSTRLQGSSDTSTRWSGVSEASTCGSPFTRTPFVSSSGRVLYGDPILGPFGSYFGRSVAQVNAHLVRWTVPGSGGERLLVHEKALPAFQRVSDGLRTEALKGHTYAVRSVSTFESRTIGGSRQLSRHALGLAIDINPQQNPYRGDDRLITDMPQWYVDVWRDAGFCWGGDWKYVKDPMHFSWMGPGATPETDDPFDPLPPATALQAFGPRADIHSTEFGPVLNRYALAIADATGNGAPDVVGLRSHPDGAVIDIASSTRLWGECSISRWFVPDTAVATADYTLFMDVDSDSGQDLVTLTAGPSAMNATVATRGAEFEDVTFKTTGLDPELVAVAGADFDGDRVADLWEVRPDGELRIFGGDDFDVLLSSDQLPGGPPVAIAPADRDGGDTPELFALYPSGPTSKVSVLRLGTDWEIEDTFTVPVPISAIAAMGAVDYDGDGRTDVEILDDQGQLMVYLGNTSTGISPRRWFAHPVQTCTGEQIKLAFSGLFYDDEGSIFESAIDNLGASEITRGCNPPFNDNFCPDDYVTRGQMAAFLVRALDL